MSLLTTVTALLPTVAGLLDRLIPDPEQKAKAQLELLRLQQEGAFKADRCRRCRCPAAAVARRGAVRTGVREAGARNAAISGSMEVDECDHAEPMSLKRNG